MSFKMLIVNMLLKQPSFFGGTLSLELRTCLKGFISIQLQKHEVMFNTDAEVVSKSSQMC